MRIMTQVDEPVAATISQAAPEAEVILVSPKGEVDPALRGEALVVAHGATNLDTH
jgi:hypothetical protein